MARLLRSFLLLALTATILLAQNRVSFPWWNSPVIDDPQLGLSQTQKQRIRQIVRSYRSRLLDARNNANKAEQDLEDMLNEQDVSTQAAQPAIERAAEARAGASRVFLSMSFELRSVLTLDQWRQLVHRWDEVQRKKPQDTQVPPD
ncbi:MAG: periplasmic heavy metal sensor [Acidobacteriaceae bacterium]|nr:periplasmic heavy metal sensor [Acidobacteriaceae bacterium]